MIRPADLVEYAMGCLKSGGKQGGYIFGSRGQMCTRKLREDCAVANPSQASMILTTGEKWDGHYVWDCSGIMRGAWRALATYKSGGATTIYTKWCSRKGMIDTIPEEPGTFICRGTGATMQHIGVYVGNGMAVDARGTKEGVLYTRLDSYPWTHWCQADDVDFKSKDQPSGIVLSALWEGKVKTKTGSGVGIWQDNTKRVRIALIPDGATVEVLDDPDGKGFAACRYGVYVGAVDLQYVYPADGEASQELIYRAQVVGVKYGLDLRTTPEKVKNTILLIPPNAVIEVFEGAGRGGFALARHESITGYCTAQYLKRLPDTAA